jgi:hypothetical protein
MQTQTLYETDFALWVAEQIKAMQQGRFEAVDWENVIEELQSLGVSEKRALGSQLRRLIMHLLKWHYQPDKRSRSWEASITSARNEIEQLLELSPSLKTYILQTLSKEYQRARREAQCDTGLPVGAFPAQCPYTLEQLLDSEYMP